MNNHTSKRAEGVQLRRIKIEEIVSFIYFSPNETEDAQMNLIEACLLSFLEVWLPRALLDFHGGVDLAHENVRGDEADRARQNPERETDQERVAEVEHRGNEFSDVQLERTRQ